MSMPRLKPHRVPYDFRGGRRAMPLEAWQPRRTVVAGCVRVRWVRRSRTQNSVPSTDSTAVSPDWDFLRIEGWLLALLDEAESFFISHISCESLRILLFLFGNSY